MKTGLEVRFMRSLDNYRLDGRNACSFVNRGGQLLSEIASLIDYETHGGFFHLNGIFEGVFMKRNSTRFHSA